MRRTLPYVYCLVAATRRDERAAGRVRDALDLALVPLKRRRAFPLAPRHPVRIAHLHSHITVVVVVRLRCLLLFPCVCLRVEARGEERRARRRPRDAAHCFGVSRLYLTLQFKFVFIVRVGRDGSCGSRLVGLSTVVIESDGFI